MPNHYRSQTLELQRTTKEEFEKSNERPLLESECAPPEGKVPMEVIKEEISTDVTLKVEHLDLDEYLNEKATKLYSAQLDSTVIEYDDEEGCRRVSLVAFVGKRCALEDGKVPDAYVQKLAALLNRLADEGVWKFGTMGRAFSMPTLRDASGSPLYDVYAPVRTIISQAAAKDDPRGFEWEPITAEAFAERVKERGQQAFVGVYIAVAPEFCRGELWPNGDELMMVEKLNGVVGCSAFVREGDMGDDDWEGFPELK